MNKEEFAGGRGRSLPSQTLVAIYMRACVYVEFSSLERKMYASGFSKFFLKVRFERH